MFKYVVAALAAGAEAQSRFRGRRRRNRRMSVDQTLYTAAGDDPLATGGMTEHARAVYVPRKAYGTFAGTAERDAVKENENVRGIIIGEAVDAAAGTAILTTNVYAFFMNLANDPTRYGVVIDTAANLKLWKCTWDTIVEIQAETALTAVPTVLPNAATYSTRSGVLSRTNSNDAGYVALEPVANMDIKSNVADSAGSAGQGRRSFRGTGWRRTGAASTAASTTIDANATTAATNINYVIELRGRDIAQGAGATIERIGCGVFRSSNEEYTKKQIEDIFNPLGAYTAAVTNAGQVLSEQQGNQTVDPPATPPAVNVNAGLQPLTPGTAASTTGAGWDGTGAGTATTFNTIV